MALRLAKGSSESPVIVSSSFDTSLSIGVHEIDDSCRSDEFSRPSVGEAEFVVTGKPTRWKYIWDKMRRVMANIIGSIWAFAFYRVGIFAWVGIGPIFKFSNTRQLYVNTATAFSLTITSVFLQNIQQQQEDKLENCLHYALQADAEVEFRLRELTDNKLNPIFEIPVRKPNFLERQSDYFSAVIRPMLGFIITIVVLVAWGAVGPILQFDDLVRHIFAVVISTKS